MAFTTDHEITVVKTETGVDVLSSGEKFAAILNSTRRLQLAVVADPEKSGLDVETDGPSAGKVKVV